jgi:uncharacterized protein YvpB
MNRRWLTIWIVLSLFSSLVNITQASTVAKQTKPKSVILEAPLILQKPGLYNGCEVTSMTMLLLYANIDANKMKLAAAMPKDPTPLQLNKNGTIRYWGDPNVGFVGDVTGKRRGYAINQKAMFPFLKKYISRAVNLSGKYYPSLEAKLAEKRPIVVWTTVHYDRPWSWVEWNSPTGKVRATFQTHAVLLVGYDEKYVYVNDPLSSQKKKRIDKAKFIRGWEAMGRQAITY